MTLSEAAERFAAGEPALVGDAAEPAVVALAGAHAGADALGALYALGGDLVVVGLERTRADQLGLAALAGVGPRRDGLVPVTPVDAAGGGEAAVSLAGRARTIRMLADPGCRPDQLLTPGHVQPGWASGHGAPALALELARAAGAPAAVALAQLRDRSGRPIDGAEARRDPRLRALAAPPAEALRARVLARQVRDAEAVCMLPTRLGEFHAAGRAERRGRDGRDVVLALIHGDPAAHPAPLVRSHVACLFGDTFGSLACGCGARLRESAAAIVAAGAGVLVYLKPAVENPFACPAGRPVDPALAREALDDAGLPLAA